jgi:hypothetical protein
MSNDNKTLADVQPGGRVRLGDQAELDRLEFQAWAEQLKHTLTRWGNGPGDVTPLFVSEVAGNYISPVTQAAWEAWRHLSAQPSPGGQGAPFPWENFPAYLIDRCEGDTISEEGLQQALPSMAKDQRYCLAARQPSKQPDSVALDEATEFCIEKGDRQPVGQELWCLHVLGMDDVHPAPSKAHAEKAAAWHNEQFKGQAARLGISIEAKVVPWPHSAESHAAGVAEFIPQWLIPQWQLDALEANTKQPAQAVDLGQSPHGIRLVEIPRRNGLDPINVFVQDYELGRGRIVVTCYGQAWCGFWGAMGERTVMQFVAACDADYVAGNMLSGRHEHVKKHERAYVERIATEVIAEFRALLDSQAVGNA